MNAIRAILGWVFRNAILFALIVAALIAHAVWSEGRTAERAQTSAITSEIASIEKTKIEAAKVRKEAQATATAAASDENGGAKLDHGSGGEVLLRAA